MARNGRIEYSDEYRFLEDERVYLIKLYARGFAKDNNAFVVLDITDLQPVRFKVVSETEEKIYSADLAELKIGSLELTPQFAAETTSYTATTSNDTNVIKVVPASGSAEVEITVGEKQVTNGTATTWAEGSNTVKVVVTDGEKTKTYTVTVTKE